MLKEIAIADAYGAGFEFSTPEKISSKNDLSTFHKHELYDIQGRYTDDTQLTMAISEVLLEKAMPDKEDFAQKILDCFKRDPRPGYSKGFYDLLCNANSVTDLLEKLNPNSTRNGAAIRSIPIGYINNMDEVIHVAKVQASLTHNTSLGILSSTAVATIAHYALHKEIALQDIPQVLEKHDLNQWNLNWTTTVSVSAYDTVSAALSCLINNTSLSQLLIGCVDLGGDTDSVASIAVGLATCFGEYHNDLPKCLYDRLDEPAYGISYLDDLEAALNRRYR